MDYGELHRIRGLPVTLGHQGWDCRGHEDSKGLQGIMIAYRGAAGSDSCGLRIILKFLQLAGLENKVSANCPRQIQHYSP